MKPLTATTKIKKATAIDEIILLPFSEDETDFEQLQKEYEEDRMLSLLNEAGSVMEEIKMINKVNFNKLSRVA
jgi:hypothetical protein